MDVLVAYATKNGSTEQVAEAIARVMRERGAHVTLRRATTTAREPVTSYHLVVLGAPLYSGRWHKDANRFLRRHHSDLAGVPVAIFATGPRQDTEDAWRRSRAQLDKTLAKRAWLNPVAVTVFGGSDPPRRSPRVRRDLRNWDSIRAGRGKFLPSSGRAPSFRQPTAATDRCNLQEAQAMDGTTKIADATWRDSTAPRFRGKYLSLTSYKRDGTPVATPVWFAELGGKLLVETDANSGKAKRIRRNPDVRIAICTASGRLRGAHAQAVAELLPESHVSQAEQLIRRKYRADLIVIAPLRFLQSAVHLGRPRTKPVILAIRPG
jgi:menaquinone-dependent protoporphyrinogen oxidase